MQRGRARIRSSRARSIHCHKRVYGWIVPWTESYGYETLLVVDVGIVIHLA